MRASTSAVSEVSCNCSKLDAMHRGAAVVTTDVLSLAPAATQSHEDVMTDTNVNFHAGNQTNARFETMSGKVLLPRQSLKVGPQGAIHSNPHTAIHGSPLHVRLECENSLFVSLQGTPRAPTPPFRVQIGPRQLPLPTPRHHAMHERCPHTYR